MPPIPVPIRFLCTFRGRTREGGFILLRLQVKIRRPIGETHQWLKNMTIEAVRTPHIRAKRIVMLVISCGIEVLFWEIENVDFFPAIDDAWKWISSKTTTPAYEFDCSLIKSLPGW